jgi:hypothetical protein
MLPFYGKPYRQPSNLNFRTNHGVDENCTTPTSTMEINNKPSILNQQPKNISVHNLCTCLLPPIGTKNLLGLSLKYCAVPSKPFSTIKDSLLKLFYRIRNRHYLVQNPSATKNEYTPQIVVKFIKG